MKMMPRGPPALSFSMGCLDLLRAIAFIWTMVNLVAGARNHLDLQLRHLLSGSL
jgi:hypothetical protein